MEKSQPIIHQKMIAILKGVSPIGKDRTNPQQNYKFRGIDDMYNELHTHFAEHGVFITPEVLEMNREERPSKNGGLLIWTLVKVRFTFTAEDGSNISGTVPGEAMDSGDKGLNKAMSAALKYTLMQMLLIPTEDKKDSEDDTPEVKDPKQIMKEECLDLISKCKDVDDLKQLKEMYNDLFMKDKDVKSASTEKYKKISQPAQQ